MSIWGKGNSGASRTAGGDGFNGDSNFDNYGNELPSNGRNTPDLGGYQRGKNRAGDGLSGDANFDAFGNEVPSNGRGTPDLGGYVRGKNRTGDDFGGDSNFDREGREIDGSARYVPDLGGYQNRQKHHHHPGHHGGLDDDPNLRVGGTTLHGQGQHGGFDEQKSMNTGAGVAGGHGATYSTGGTHAADPEGAAGTNPNAPPPLQHKPTMGEKIKDSLGKITHHGQKTETGAVTNK